MSTIIERFEKIKSKITSLGSNKPINIIAVSKTFSLDYIKPLIDHGHLHFGENKVQEAQVKWLETKKENQNLKLHMVGKLQTNKAKDAVKLFDYIHSLDNPKLADALAKYQKSLNKNLNYFIQVNVDILGLMVIPPIDQNVDNFFKTTNTLNKSLALENLSMGMSADYIAAIKHGSNFVRIGRSIFGSRSELLDSFL